MEDPADANLPSYRVEVFNGSAMSSCDVVHMELHQRHASVCVGCGTSVFLLTPQDAGITEALPDAGR